MRVHFCRSTIAPLPILADEVKRVLAVVGADYGDFDGDFTLVLPKRAIRFRRAIGMFLTDIQLPFARWRIHPSFFLVSRHPLTIGK
jgi:hypothetical protein